MKGMNGGVATNVQSTPLMAVKNGTKPKINNGSGFLPHETKMMPSGGSQSTSKANIINTG